MKNLLSDEFYGIREMNFISEPEEKITALLELNPAHAVFAGHFPGNPVVPGVCMVQMIKEMLSRHLNKELAMVSAAEVKFMSVVNPALNALLLMEIKLKPQSGENYNVSATIVNGEQLSMKFRGSFKEEEEQGNVLP